MLHPDKEFDKKLKEKLKKESEEKIKKDPKNKAKKKIAKKKKAKVSKSDTKLNKEYYEVKLNKEYYNAEPTNVPIVYKTKHCAILSMHFNILSDGEGDYYSGGGSGAAKVLGRALGESLAAGFREDFIPPQVILTSQSVLLAEAYNTLIEEGWVPQSTGFGGAGAGRTMHNHGYIFIQIFTKPKGKVKKKDKEE